LETVATRLNIEDGVCLVDLPFWEPLASQLKARLGWKLIYDCMDFHAGFGNVHSRLADTERQLTEESDAVLVTSKILLGQVNASKTPPVEVPNAADFEHFRFAPPVRPSDLPGVGQPIIGYYGAISEWFDADLIEHLAGARPEWQFVLVGNHHGASIASLRR